MHLTLQEYTSFDPASQLEIIETLGDLLLEMEEEGRRIRLFKYADFYIETETDIYGEFRLNCYVNDRIVREYFASYIKIEKVL